MRWRTGIGTAGNHSDSWRISRCSAYPCSAILGKRRKRFHGVTVRANWRITFRFAEGYALDVNLEDYH